MSSRQRKSTGLAMVDVLEPRRLFAGNVTVTAEPPSAAHPFGFVHVDGDNKDNDITIIANVVSFNVIGNAGTTVTFNGVTGPGAIVPGGGLDASLGNGSDRVQLTGLATLDSINVETGNGSDIVLATNVITQSLAVSTGNGDDLVRLSNINLLSASGLVVDTGNGDDDMTGGLIQALNVPGTRVHVGLGKGNDDLLLDGPWFVSGLPGATSIDGDKGTDSITNPAFLIYAPPLPPGTPPHEGFEIILP